MAGLVEFGCELAYSIFMQKIMNFSKYFAFLILTLAFAIGCQHKQTVVPERNVAEAENEGLKAKDYKKYFQEIDSAKRLKIINDAEIFVPHDKPVEAMHIVEDFVKPNCEANFSYLENGKVNWPEYTCNYIADAEPKKKLGGGSPKFLCEFADDTKKSGKSVKRVKYSNANLIKLKGEVPDVILASSISKLMGFPTNFYCPMRITCIGCPSDDPWEKNGRATGPAQPGSVVKFSYAMSNVDFPGYVISASEDKKAVQWEELKLAKVPNASAADDAERVRKLIEREAWMLWFHFIQHTDAHVENQHVACLKATTNSSGTIECEKSAIYAHDYGHAFNTHLNLKLGWSQNPTFKPGSNKCEGILSSNGGVKPRPAVEGIIMGSKISEEARALLVSRLEKITEDQWTQAFVLSRAEKASRINEKEWLDMVKTKIGELQSARCPAFSEGKSVLAN